jgi:DNA-binding response OmpR family regulator
VLIVDDEPEIVELLQEVLTEAGYDVRSVFTSDEALAVALGFRPHVVLLDLRMPGMSGDQVLRALRERGIQAPVIAISAKPELAGPGFFRVVGKPMDMREVPQVVAAALRAGGAPNA